jgi:hypothetical protein
VVAQETIVVEELAVVIVVKEDDKKIIKMGHGICHEHFLRGLQSGNHELILLAIILTLEIDNNHSKPSTQNSWAETTIGTHDFYTFVIHTNKHSSCNADFIYGSSR